MASGEDLLQPHSRGFLVIAAPIVLAGLCARGADPILSQVTLREGRGGMADSVTDLGLATNPAAGNRWSVEPQPPSNRAA